MAREEGEGAIGVRLPRPLHIPVLLQEVIEYLNPNPGEFFIDGTLGGGGYAEAIIRRIATGGTFVGFDLDLETFMGGGPRMRASETMGVAVTLVNDNFSRVPEFLAARGYGKADGFVLDLGFSSDQLEHSGRGVSFRNDEPLLMTYDADAKPVREILRGIREDELRRILVEFGEERFAKHIARAICLREARKPIETSGTLAEVVASAVPRSYARGRIHPATRTFMAFRIYANHELEHLRKILDSLEAIMKPGGRVCVVSFHSLEDRIVKNCFKKFERRGVAESLTKKPVRPTESEVKKNPRARSAKLRAMRFT